MEKLTINIIRSADSIVFFNRINSLNELFVKGEEIIFAHWDRVDFMKAPNVHFNFPNTLENLYVRCYVLSHDANEGFY